VGELREYRMEKYTPEIPKKINQSPINDQKPPDNSNAENSGSIQIYLSVF
jgi:hypothetical protein